MPWIASTQRHYNDLLGVRNETACSLTIFGHIAKVGGTTVVELLDHLGFQKVRSLPQLMQSRDMRALDNLTATHAYAHMHPWPTELLHLLRYGLARLKAAYAARGCLLQTVTVLRSPPALELSAYRYFRLNGGLGVRPSLSPSSTARRNHTWIAQDFASWVVAHRDMQVAWLMGSCPPPHQHQRGTAGNETCALPSSAECPADVRNLLASFDVVGVSERLSEFLWLVAARAGVFLNLVSSESAVHNQSNSSGSASAISKDFTIANLADCNVQPPASLRSSIPAQASHERSGKMAIDDATRCDKLLYTKAQERADKVRRDALELHSQVAGGITYGLRPFAASQHCNK